MRLTMYLLVNFDINSIVDSCLNQAKSQLRSEFSCTYTISERISAEIASLDALRPTRGAHQSDGEGRGAFGRGLFA